MELQTLLRQLCLAEGVGGQTAVSTLAEELLRELGLTPVRDALGSVTARRTCGRANAPCLLLEAHIDQVGWVVTRIDDAGFVRVAPCGGVDRRAAIDAAVTVYADRPLPGVFATLPPHLQSGEHTLPEWDALGIDVGLTAEQARRRIPAGSRVAFTPRFDAIQGTRVCGTALDDRAGVAAVLACLEQLRGDDLPCDLAVAFAVQEELGCRGAHGAAYALRPDAAVAVDVSFAHTPDADRAKCGRLGGGPMLGWAPVLDDTLTRRLAALAAEAALPLQDEVMGGDTGTDADTIADARSGVPTALLSIPLRYMHTPVEVVDTADVAHTARLMAALARTFEGRERA